MIDDGIEACLYCGSLSHKSEDCTPEQQLAVVKEYLASARRKFACPLCGRVMFNWEPMSRHIDKCKLKKDRR